ncbi:hypothetical protein EJ02DRAFT_113870 [Clathrospora elynae]|uniref:Uncharacterized protein n=1 Tax=Clathrospora elynae TaxID=706981 RepID=A0A6A5SUS6_9PLEO|nr:hypothetical protein EJ02DRAFT_113870 [Clathrospora elynae]
MNHLCQDHTPFHLQPHPFSPSTTTSRQPDLESLPREDRINPTKKKTSKNIQQRGFASGHPPNY